ncbi:MAG: PTS transporter subunit EIIC [Alphaproteobacteria bacterium]|jgi:PTS system N-acetylglucosamine-specific IIC component|nr:PTS transporter subunit EIIC [Alphaproteobacteria bacterium]
MWHKFFDLLQQIGRALFLPIAVLPAAGLLLRFGQADLLDLPFLAKSGEAVFANLGLLFAMGVAGGMSKDKNISAGLSGAIIYLVMGAGMKELDVANDMGTLGGIIAGLTGGYLYNRFYQTKLPVYLAFFGGRRFVPIVSGLVAIVFGLVFGLIWPYIMLAIESFSKWVTESGVFGMFVYGVSNRILLPTGLQHITEALAYFTIGSFTTADGTVLTGDLTRFFHGDPTAGIFMSGFFPVMIFGLPAAALAMYLAAKKENRPLVLGLLLSGAFTALLTGVTEPIEFPILFAAPLLYGIHAILMGVSYSVAYLVGYKAGFTFSGGIIDLALSWGISTKPYMIFILGPIFFAIYFFVFYTLIKALNLKTPGREDDGETVGGSKASSMFDDSSHSEKAENIFKALGGVDNVLVIDNCISRLRLKLNDINLIDEAMLKKNGAKGIVKSGNDIQVIIGTDVEFYADAMKNIKK